MIRRVVMRDRSERVTTATLPDGRLYTTIVSSWRCLLECDHEVDRTSPLEETTCEHCQEAP